jgi:hypothetical protein
MRKGTLVVHLRRHHLMLLRWHRVFSILCHFCIFILLVVIVAASLAFKVGRTFVFVRLAIL